MPLTTLNKESVSWNTMKFAQARDGFDFFYLEKDSNSKSYDVYGSNAVCFIHSVITGDEGNDFETNYKSAATAVPSRADALILSQPPISSNCIPQMEIVSRFGRPDFQQYTITSHNWCKKTTWFQGYTSWTGEAMEPDAPGVYTTYKLSSPNNNTTWINIDDFTVTLQDYALNAAPYGQVGVWQTDGSRISKETYRPVIKVNGTTQTSGYTIDYSTGKVTFGSALSSGDTVTASFRSVNTSHASDFILRPRAGKRLSIPHTEINLTDDFLITGTVVFEVWAGTPDWLMIPEYEPYYLQYRMEYKSMAQIWGLSVVGGDYYPSIGGTDSIEASAETGWSTDQKRGLASGLREIPYDFGVAAGWGKSIILRSDQYAQIRAYIKNDAVLGGEYCSLSLYVEEENL